MGKRRATIKPLKELIDSKGATESIKRLRPSSLFLLLLVVGIPFIIKFLFKDVTGYNLMVWIWFIMAIISMIIAIYSYSIDMAAFVKRNNYEQVEQ